MLKILFPFLLIFSVISCNTKEKSPDINTKISSQAKEENVENSKNITEGTFEGTNEDGDYSLFLLRKDNGEIESFIYTADSILDNSSSYKGKRLSVEWQKDKFEEAGSSEMFDAKLLLGVKFLK